MSSFILQLSLISVFGLMVQSAPIHLTKRSTCTIDNTTRTVLEKRLFHAARDLHNANGQLGNYLSSLSEIVINNTETIHKTKKIASETFSTFSYRCQHFTKVMTLKLQLQDHLFSAENTSYINQNAKQLAKMLTSLQTMADTFDDIEFDKDNRRCIKLTPSQYKIMTLLESKFDLNKWYNGFNKNLCQLRARVN